MTPKQGNFCPETFSFFFQWNKVVFYCTEKKDVGSTWAVFFCPIIYINTRGEKKKENNNPQLCLVRMTSSLTKKVAYNFDHIVFFFLKRSQTFSARAKHKFSSKNTQKNKSSFFLPIVAIENPPLNTDRIFLSLSLSPSLSVLLSFLFLPRRHDLFLPPHTFFYTKEKT